MMTTSDPPMTSDTPADAAVSAITFADGLIGCPHWPHFVLITDDEEDLPVGVLQSQDDPKVSLMITDPCLILPEYTIALDAETRKALELGSGQPTAYCTLSVSAEGELTANLLGPLVVNPSNRRG